MRQRHLIDSARHPLLGLIEGAWHYLLTLLLIVGAASAQDVGQMDAVVSTYVPGQFTGAVLVGRGDQILFSRGYGLADIEWNIRNTPTTRFRIGSITKQFTAAAILLLEERGDLSVDDPVATYLPDSPDSWDNITIFHLLTHTAGVPDFTGFPGFAQMRRFPITPAETVASFMDEPLDFEPGSDFSYSNSGYVLLGHLIEVVSGQSYEEFLSENIFAPLAMSGSGYDWSWKVIPQRASGYSSGAAGTANADFVDMSVPYAAGALYSTTEDLLRWTSGLFGGDLLSAGSLDKMTTPVREDYAFGLLVTTEDGRRVIRHHGGISGFSATLEYYPDQELTVAVLANLAGAENSEIASELGRIVLGDDLGLTSEAEEVVVPTQLLGEYVGTYSLAPGVDMMVTLDDAELRGQVSGQPQIQLFAASQTRFFLSAVEAEIEFFRDEGGEVRYLVLDQAGRDTMAYRTSDTVRVRTEITLPVGVLESFVGPYEMETGSRLDVSLEAGQLGVGPEGQDVIPIFPETETTFFLRVIDATIEFFKDETGAVTHLILYQGPAETRANRQ